MNTGLRETMSPQSISIGADEETNMKQTHLISIYFSIFIDPKSKIIILSYPQLVSTALSLLSSEIFCQQKISNKSKQDLPSFISIKTKMSNGPQGSARMHQKNNKKCNLFCYIVLFKLSIYCNP